MREDLLKKKICPKLFFGLFLFFVLGGFLVVPVANILADESEDNTTAGKTTNMGRGIQAAYEAQRLADIVCDGIKAKGGKCPAKTIKTVTASLIQKMSPLLKAAAINITISTSQYVLDTLAYESAIWVATGGEGETPLFDGSSPLEAWKKFGLDTVSNAIGSLSKDLNDYLDVDFNLCAPANPMFRLGFALGIKSAFQPPKPICDWQSISSNWEGWYKSIAETAESPNEAVLKAVAQGLRPGQNTLSYFAEVNIRIKQEALAAKPPQFAQFIKDSGFQPVVDIVTGKGTIPADFVRERLSTQINEAQKHNWEASEKAAFANADILPMMLTHVTSVFVNTLLSTWIDKWKTGLLNVEPLGDIDLGDELTTSTDYGAAAEEYYADVVSTMPVSIEDYNILSEFIICPGNDSRQMNNCVMDISFAAAISKSGPTDLMTVSKALEQGALKGDWPLYSSENLSKNQDAYCYTYGYCYSNLVKMRKARIISIGWEIAANSLQNSVANPVTLQDVVDGFNECNSDGQLDAAHPWCHLIDPNWVLKYPEQKCDASMITNLTISSSSPGRAGACVDISDCVVENADGTCGGFGNCVREQNTWNFNGDECPDQYATCLSFTNADTSEKKSWLFNSLSQGVCSADNAGCLWYKINKHFNNAGTTDDTEDDSFEWLPGSELYITANREDDVLSYNTAGAISDRETYYYDPNGDGTNESSYETYAYEDRIYFTSDIAACTEESAGCNELYKIGDSLSLNVLRNPSFEDDTDDVADYWTTSGSGVDYDQSGSNAYDGDKSYYLASTSDSVTQINISLQPETFYTISLYAKGGVANAAGKAVLDFVAADNSSVNLTGYSTDCTNIDSNTLKLPFASLESGEFKSFDCTFTTPSLTDANAKIALNLTINSVTDSIYVDAVQLEARETPSTFHEGYNESTITTEYLKTPPTWLGCTGQSTDSADCDNYTTVCSATEAGCSLYTPTNSDPAVPAVLADEDQCPTECVGYSTYKQEDTDYDTGEFPLYFIASTAESCTTAQVGCDEFTNLETEEIEKFSYLRACVTTEMTADEEVFFTWEGSDNSGYQLVSYQLLASNLTTGTVSYTEDADGDRVIDTDLVNDSHVAEAPCTNWIVSATGLTCADSLTEIAATDECNEHADIFTEPDCREFYDKNGDVHYRLYSETVSITDECTAYRKTDANSTDCTNSGGYWTTSGECRYFVYAAESTSCSAPGCREYTGGGSHNASAIFTDYFEEGNYNNFEIKTASSATLSISNESVAVDGHSLRVVTTSSGAIIQTQQDYNVDEAECVEIDGCESENSECTVAEGEIGCGVLNDYLVSGKTFVIKFWAKGTGQLSAELTNNGGTDDYNRFGSIITLTSDWQLYELGPLDSSSEDFESSNEFNENAVLNFRASAVGQVFYLDNIQLEQTEEDLTLIRDSWVTPSTCNETPDGAVSEQYYLGCEAYTDQNDQTFDIYQFTDLCSEEAVGCEAVYQTQNSSDEYSQAFNLTCYNPDGTDADLEFDTVTAATTCYMSGEEVCTILVGYNNCQFDYDGNLPVPLPINIALGPEAAYVSPDEVKYFIVNDDFSCTAENKGCIEVGLPTFSQDKTMVNSFESVYLLNQPDNYDNTLCSNNELFCTEWASTEDGDFYFKDPGDKACEYKTGVSLNNTSYDGWFRSGTTEFCYGVGTCSEDGEFCTEDADCGTIGGSCQIGIGSVCSVSLATCEDDGDCASGAGDCEPTSGNYIINGNISGIWFNGDDEYAGWAGVCQSQYDLCSEFIDPIDTKEGEEIGGKSYYFLDNESLDESGLNSTDRCNGQASLQEGCTLFNDTMDTNLSYSTSPSYLVSEHADLFFGEDPRSLQDPVSCDDLSDGIFTTTTGTSINVCEQRCAYNVLSNHEITNLPTIAGPINTTFGIIKYFGSACVYDSDCQLATDSIGTTVEGSCFNLDVDGDQTIDSDELVFDFNGDGVYDAGRDTKADLNSYVSINDANRVLKVYRDRICAEWLSCSGSYPAWNDSQKKWVDVCQGLSLCDSYNMGGGGGGFCDGLIKEDPIVLSSERYSSRDVSWYGLEYAGSAIPNQLPVEMYEQFNIAPEGYCGSAYGSSIDISLSCSSDDDCTNVTYPSCRALEEFDSETLREYGLDSSGSDYYLVYKTSFCDEAEGSTCTSGYCTDTGDACSTNEECPTGVCIIGDCVTVNDNKRCLGDEDCRTSSPYSTCSDGVCTWNQGTNCSESSECSHSYDDDVSIITSCQPGGLAKTGTCYNDSCLVGIDGTAFDPIDDDEKGCRGYPEAESPFPLRVVQDWIDPTDLVYKTPDEDILKDDWSLTPDEFQISVALDPEEADVMPYNFISGFQDSSTCSPVLSSDGSYYLYSDCDCSYEKVEYGDSGIKKYYPIDTRTDEVLSGVCSGGLAPGSGCSADDDCNNFDIDDDGYDVDEDVTGTGGICGLISRKDSLYGWDGYCIEKDTSIQLYGSSDQDDYACLTWLPIDQLRGSRDMYANDLDAGFALNESAYYCTEVAMYADLYPTGTTLNSDGSVRNMDYACAFSYPDLGSGDIGTYDGCYYGLFGAADQADNNCRTNVYCPEGYIGIVGTCNQDINPDSRQREFMYPYSSGEVDVDEGICDSEDVCDNTWATASTNTICHDDTSDSEGTDTSEKAGYLGDAVNDCPYFCIPMGATHTEDEAEGSDAGQPCDADLQSLSEQYPDRNDRSGIFGSAASRFGTPVITAFDLYNAQTSAAWGDWATGYSVKTKFMDCVKHGVPVGFSEYSTNPLDNANDLIAAGELAGLTDNKYFYATGSSYGHGSYGVSYRPFEGSIGACSVTSEVCFVDSDCPSLAENVCNCTDAGEGCSGSCTMSTRTTCTVGSLSPVPCPTTQTCVSPNTGLSLGSYFPYLGCYELAEVSNPTEGNKAWTNRIWDGASRRYSAVIGTGFSEAYDYTALSEPVRAGRALYEEYFTNGLVTDSQNDSWPLPVYSCGTGGADLHTEPQSENCSDRFAYPTSTVMAAPYEQFTVGTSVGFMSGHYSETLFDAAGSSQHSLPYSITELLQQFFAEVYNIYQYDWDAVSQTGWSGGGGAYVPKETGIITGLEDISKFGDDFNDSTGAFDGEPVPPKIASVGLCYGTDCLENTEGKFSVNGLDGGSMEFSGGSAHVTVSFFAWADSNQMPIRDITVDWGDGDHAASPLMEWPIDTSSQTGTRGSDESYYKNRRGIIAEEQPICGGDDSDAEWGLQPDACETAYFSLEKDYYCSKEMAEETLPACKPTGDGTKRLLNSPCVDSGDFSIGPGKCVFQPRVHVKDNWGWCTGVCDTVRGEDGGSSAAGCYEGETYKECDTNLCPGDDSGNACPDYYGGTDNPWINFDGYVVVDWAN